MRILINTSLPKLALAIIFANITATNALADLFSGPTSPYYLDSGRAVYVIQGTTVVNSFPLVYGNVGDEAVMAVSNTVNTRPAFTGPGSGGQYTLAGTPTGVTEPYPIPPQVQSEVSYDGTSSGQQNFYVEHFGVSGPNTTYNVYVTDLTWQHPYELFSLQEPTGGDKYQGIAYDPRNNSLWISEASMILDYSLDGNLLFSFGSPLFNPSPQIGPEINTALGYDNADNTLWITYNGSNLLEQYSTTGALLQYGTPTGLPNGDYASGDFSSPVPPPWPPAVPEPASIVLLATVAGALYCVKRRIIGS
jgi:hypothetical protein